VCSLLTNTTADRNLKNLPKKDAASIEKKFAMFAGNSNVETPGILDQPANHLHVLPHDLKDVRRHRSGRQRVFYIGNFSQCSFTIIFVKEFKKKGKNDEADLSLHNLLRNAIGDTSKGRELRAPDPKKS